MYKKTKTKVKGGGATIGTGSNYSDALSATLKTKKSINKRGAGGDLSSRVDYESALPEHEPVFVELKRPEPSEADLEY